MNVLGLIPARGGSKGIRRKNLTLLNGKPLIEYTIGAARGSRYLSRIIVSTDDPEIADVSLALGAEVPFLRPDALAQDETGAGEVMIHAIDWLEQNESWVADIIVYLQPTSPLRKSHHIDDAIQLLASDNLDVVVSVTEVPHQYTPESLMHIRDGRLFPHYERSTQVTRRQEKGSYFARNGPAVLACTRHSLYSPRGFYGEPNRVLPLVMDARDSIDIDSELDLVLASCLMREA